MPSPKVAVVMGSSSDLDYARETLKALELFGIGFDLVVTSAHRSPARTADFARSAAGQGYSAVIALAGYSAHLAGSLAAGTNLPVIGVPLDSSPLAGVDALLATAQMPRGVPVAALAVGKAGAYNAGVLAARIIALSDSDVASRLEDFSQRLEASVDKADAEVAEKLRAGE